MSKKFKIFFAVFVFAAYTLYSVALVPLYSVLCNDIIYSDTYFPEVVEFFSSAVELAVFVLIYSTVIYVSVTESLKSAKYYSLVYIGGLLFKYALNLVANLILAGYFDTFWLVSILGNIVIELILFGIVILISGKASKEFAFDDKKPELIFPFKKLLAFNNPVQKAAFFSALVIGIPKILSRIIYDISYGAPTLNEVPTMIAYYSFDVIVAVIGYLALIWCLMTLNKLQSREKI